jgi:hypothetical protein
LRERVDGLETKVTALEDKLSKVSYEPKGLNGLPTVKITGANPQVANGTGDNQRLNGLGNVIVGYDEHPDNVKQTGSDNVVIGEKQTFTSWGDLVAQSERDGVRRRHRVLRSGRRAPRARACARGSRQEPPDPRASNTPSPFSS